MSDRTKISAFILLLAITVLILCCAEWLEVDIHEMAGPDRQPLSRLV